MGKSLRAVVMKTEVTDRWSPKSILTGIAENRLIEDLKQYREGRLVYPDGRGGVKSFSREKRKDLCAPRIYAGIMCLARHGITEKAIKYAIMFDKEFTLDHAHINQVYL